MLAVLAQAAEAFTKPVMDYGAIAPELVLVGTVILLALLDSWKLERARAAMPALAGIGLLVALIPLAHPLEGDAPAVLLVMARQRVGQSLALPMFARVHGLTPTEESVLRGLCEGMEVDEIAAEHGVAESTVRTQVRSLRDKTGAGGIRQLVQRVMALPPVVPALRTGRPLAG